MRCLTLAEALREQGHDCHFVCREHTGNLIAAIQKRGFPVHGLPQTGGSRGGDADEAEPAHAAWLGVSWRTDAQETDEFISSLEAAWLVVDHYALDARWEDRVRAQVGRLLVIDDLADRRHEADLLLDQNLGREAVDYSGLVPDHCQRFIGPRYALLRPEFARLREYSLQRRAEPRLDRLLITMGGVDKDNATGKVLDALRACPLLNDMEIDVVMGSNAPWLEDVRSRAAAMPRPTRVLMDISDMAERMAEADLAIGAAGSTSWERCCLGLPTLMVVLADNQVDLAAALATEGVCIRVSDIKDSGELLRGWQQGTDPSMLRALSVASASITDGLGASRLCQAMQCPT